MTQRWRCGLQAESWPTVSSEQSPQLATALGFAQVCWGCRGEGRAAPRGAVPVSVAVLSLCPAQQRPKRTDALDKLLPGAMCKVTGEGTSTGDVTRGDRRAGLSSPNSISYFPPFLVLHS